MKMLDELKVKIFSDGADFAEMIEMSKRSYIKGLTTNPTLMKKAGILDFKKFCIEVLNVVREKPLSLEVFSDDFNEMEKQAHEIHSWGDNVYVKIPITNTSGNSSIPLIRKLCNFGIKVNITAVMTEDQVVKLCDVLNNSVPSIVSVFAGRIADTGRDPVPMMKKSLQYLSSNKNSELLWASTRELLNIYQAEELGCNIITVPGEIIKKFRYINYSLERLSKETVSMFYEDALLAGYRI